MHSFSRRKKAFRAKNGLLLPEDARLSYNCTEKQDNKTLKKRKHCVKIKVPEFIGRLQEKRTPLRGKT